jgi:ornithine cyclodeaminase/alanine dehydrogenase-like protein (mu-crystallin family)
LTLFFSETQVKELLEMKEVVGAVEEAFRRQGLGEAVNSMRTRSRADGTVLNVMHASLPYLGRAGLKCYLSSHQVTNFLVVLFDLKDATPLAVMGADMLGRYRTGAASAVATKHLYRRASARLALFGAGRQAITQVQALQAILSIEEVRVWSPNPSHRTTFVAKLNELGVRAIAADSPGAASSNAEVGSTITSASTPFLSDRDVAPLAHINVCGGNHPRHSELTPEAVASFESVFVDDLPQGKMEYGDLLNAASVGKFAWENAMELGSAVAGKASLRGRTLFRSGGVAIEDVAVASLLYDKASANGTIRPGEFSFG